MASSVIAGSTGIIYFGIEIELVIAPKNSKKYKTWEHAVGDLCDEIRKELPTTSIDHDQANEKRAAAAYDKWLIVEEHNIGIGKDNSGSESSWSERGMFPAEDMGPEPISVEEFPRSFVIELISPKYRLDGTWEDDLRKIWQVIERLFNVLPSEGCGTHVHVSSEQWNLDDYLGYKRIAGAIIGCETAIDSRMPLHRQNDNVYGKSNSKHTSLKGKAFANVESEIKKIDEFKDLVKLLCPLQKGHVKEDVYDRDFKWNFTPLLNEDSNRRTIEFRQPPVSRSATDSVGWIRITTEFLQAAAGGSELDKLKAMWSAGH